MGTPYHGLNRNKKPRHISKKKLTTLSQEKEIRDKVRIRADGRCEICGLTCQIPPTYQMQFHELVFRSAGKTAGGIVSEQNTYGCDSLCHDFLQRYRLHDKQQCIRAIISARKVSKYSAEAIYDKICQFANKHGLLRESKLNSLIIPIYGKRGNGEITQFNTLSAYNEYIKSNDGKSGEI